MVQYLVTSKTSKCDLGSYKVSAVKKSSLIYLQASKSVSLKILMKLSSCQLLVMAVTEWASLGKTITLKTSVILQSLQKVICVKLENEYFS